MPMDKPNKRKKPSDLEELYARYNLSRSKSAPGTGVAVGGDKTYKLASEPYMEPLPPGYNPAGFGDTLSMKTATGIVGPSWYAKQALQQKRGQPPLTEVGLYAGRAAVRTPAGQAPAAAPIAPPSAADVKRVSALAEKMAETSSIEAVGKLAKWMTKRGYPIPQTVQFQLDVGQSQAESVAKFKYAVASLKTITDRKQLKARSLRILGGMDFTKPPWNLSEESREDLPLLGKLRGQKQRGLKDLNRPEHWVEEIDKLYDTHQDALAAKGLVAATTERTLATEDRKAQRAQDVAEVKEQRTDARTLADRRVTRAEAEIKRLETRWLKANDDDRKIIDKVLDGDDDDDSDDGLRGELKRLQEVSDSLLEPPAKGMETSDASGFGGLQTTPATQPTTQPAAAPTTQPAGEMPIVKSEADFDRLAPGTDFIAPDGTKRRKP